MFLTLYFSREWQLNICLGGFFLLSSSCWKPFSQFIAGKSINTVFERHENTRRAFAFSRRKKIIFYPTLLSKFKVNQNSVRTYLTFLSSVLLKHFAMDSTAVFTAINPIQKATIAMANTLFEQEEILRHNKSASCARARKICAPQFNNLILPCQKNYP